MVGILALGYCLAVFLDAKFYESREARNFARELRLKEGDKATPLDSIGHVATPENGGVVGRLEIPRLGVSVMVVEGADDSDLKRAVGHIPGTALPWGRATWGSQGTETRFSGLCAYPTGRQDHLSTLQGAYRYRVVSTNVVGPGDIQVLYPAGRDSLTLVTCFPFEYVGSAPKRFIVRAELIPEI